MALVTLWGVTLYCTAHLGYILHWILHCIRFYIRLYIHFIWVYICYTFLEFYGHLVTLIYHTTHLAEATQSQMATNSKEKINDLWQISCRYHQTQSRRHRALKKLDYLAGNLKPTRGVHCCLRVSINFGFPTWTISFPETGVSLIVYVVQFCFRPQVYISPVYAPVKFWRYYEEPDREIIPPLRVCRKNWDTKHRWLLFAFSAKLCDGKIHKFPQYCERGGIQFTIKI